jgi:hypothetical protein
MLGGRPEHLDALLDGEETLLGVVLRHGDDEFVEDTCGALEHVEVAIGDGIKATWINGAAHGRQR